MRRRRKRLQVQTRTCLCFQVISRFSSTCTCKYQTLLSSRCLNVVHSKKEHYSNRSEPEVRGLSGKRNTHTCTHAHGRIAQVLLRMLRECGCASVQRSGC